MILDHVWASSNLRRICAAKRLFFASLHCGYALAQENNRFAHAYSPRTFEEAQA